MQQKLLFIKPLLVLEPRELRVHIEEPYTTSAFSLFFSAPVGTEGLVQAYIDNGREMDEQIRLRPEK